MSEEGLTNTSNKRIFIGKTTFCDMEKIDEYMKKFTLVINSKNPEEIIRTLHDAVPTYVIANEYNSEHRVS